MKDQLRTVHGLLVNDKRFHLLPAGRVAFNHKVYLEIQKGTSGQHQGVNRALFLLSALRGKPAPCLSLLQEAVCISLPGVGSSHLKQHRILTATSVVTSLTPACCLPFRRSSVGSPHNLRPSSHLQRSSTEAQLDSLAYETSKVTRLETRTRSEDGVQFVSCQLQDLVLPPLIS